MKTIWFVLNANGDIMAQGTQEYCEKALLRLAHENPYVAYRLQHVTL